MNLFPNADIKISSAKKNKKRDIRGMLRLHPISWWVGFQQGDSLFRFSGELIGNLQRLPFHGRFPHRGVG